MAAVPSSRLRLPQLLGNPTTRRMLVGTLGFLPVPVIAQLFPRFAPAFFSSPAPIVSYFLFLLIPLSLPTPLCVIGYSTFESCCAKARNTPWPAGSFCRQFPC